jgi:anti-anti-sigma regulatory factor/HAMP domain-containing protein
MLAKASSEIARLSPHARRQLSNVSINNNDEEGPVFNSLTRKLLLSGAGLLLGVAIAAAFVITNVVTIRDAVGQLTNQTLDQTKLSGQFNTDIFRAIVEAHSFQRTHDLAHRDDALQELHDAQAILGQLSALSVVDSQLDQDMRAAQTELQHRRISVFDIFEPNLHEVLDSIEANDATASAHAFDQLTTIINNIKAIEEGSGDVANQAIRSSTNKIDSVIRQAMITAVGLFSLFALTVVGVLILTRRIVIRPITKLSAIAKAVAEGRLDQAVDVTNRDEVGVLQLGFRQMIASLRAANEAIVAQQRLLETRVAERTAELTQTLTSLSETVSTRDQLSEAIRELANPVLPVMQGVLVTPLIGAIDTTRVGHLQQTLLDAIERYQAHSLIIDVTGVPIIDTRVAHALLQIAQSTRLLGAQTILVGLRPELAQTIVGLGVDLSAIVTQSDLQSGVRYTLQHASLHR